MSKSQTSARKDIDSAAEFISAGETTVGFASVIEYEVKQRVIAEELKVGSDRGVEKMFG